MVLRKTMRSIQGKVLCMMLGASIFSVNASVAMFPKQSTSEAAGAEDGAKRPHPSIALSPTQEENLPPSQRPSEAASEPRMHVPGLAFLDDRALPIYVYTKLWAEYKELIKAAGRGSAWDIREVLRARQIFLPYRLIRRYDGLKSHWGSDTADMLIESNAKSIIEEEIDLCRNLCAVDSGDRYRAYTALKALDDAVSKHWKYSERHDTTITFPFAHLLTKKEPVGEIVEVINRLQQVPEKKRLENIYLLSAAFETSSLSDINLFLDWVLNHTSTGSATYLHHFTEKSDSAGGLELYELFDIVKIIHNTEEEERVGCLKEFFSETQTVREGSGFCLAWFEKYWKEPLENRTAYLQELVRQHTH